MLHEDRERPVGYQQVKDCVYNNGVSASSRRDSALCARTCRPGHRVKERVAGGGWRRKSIEGVREKKRDETKRPNGPRRAYRLVGGRRTRSLPPAKDTRSAPDTALLHLPPIAL